MTGLAIYLAPILAAALAFHVGVWWLKRYLDTRAALDAIRPSAADVNEAELSLPEMRDTFAGGAA